MFKILTLCVALLLTVGCAAIKSEPRLLSAPPKQSLETLKHYQLQQPVPEGYGQFQYEDLSKLFGPQDSSRSIKLLSVDKNNRIPLPGGINCQSRTWFLLTLGILPSTCSYQRSYSLEIEDKDLGIREQHSINFTETRTLSLFATVLMALPNWRFDSGSSDNRAVFSLIDKAVQQP